MKYLFAALLAISPGLASAQMNIICGLYRFSFDEKASPEGRVAMQSGRAPATEGLLVHAANSSSYAFYYDSLTVDFDSFSWQARFERPGDLDLDPPYITDHSCRPDPAFSNDGAGI